MELANKFIRLDILEPGTEYRCARFDWTGQIVQLIFKGIHTFCTNETFKPWKIKKLGRGFVNEFGIEQPVGYDDCATGQWFPKIGVGLLLRKSKRGYHFYKKYKIQPFDFSVERDNKKISFIGRAKETRGYACTFKKSITLKKNAFTMAYELTNVGTKPIITNEYNHNFISINNQQIDGQYVLKVPFTIDPSSFTKFVNPRKVLCLNKRHITWNKVPKKDFFIRQLNPAPLKTVSWSLEHKACKVGIKATFDFPVRTFNLWGKKHVVSPEVFFEIALAPGKTVRWQRTYEVYEL
ncbi:MAG: hypothetical protein JW822_03775 [Spirochaetales bacterium]|nr:hypothetical protein [Spirochaetales bacterium]